MSYLVAMEGKRLRALKHLSPGLRRRCFSRSKPGVSDARHVLNVRDESHGSEAARGPWAVYVSGCVRAAAWAPAGALEAAGEWADV